MDTLEDSKTKYLAVFTTIEREHGKQAAVAVQAMASFAFSFDTKTRILAELHVAGILADEAIDGVTALWTDPREKIERAMLSPVLIGLDEVEAVKLVDVLKSAARYVSSLPLEAPASVH